MDPLFPSRPPPTRPLRRLRVDKTPCSSRLLRVPGSLLVQEPGNFPTFLARVDAILPGVRISCWSLAPSVALIAPVTRSPFRQPRQNCDQSAKPLLPLRRAVLRRRPVLRFTRLVPEIPTYTVHSARAPTPRLIAARSPQHASASRARFLVSGSLVAPQAHYKNGIRNSSLPAKARSRVRPDRRGLEATGPGISRASRSSLPACRFHHPFQQSRPASKRTRHGSHGSRERPLS